MSAWVLCNVILVPSWYWVRSRTKTLDAVMRWSNTTAPRTSRGARKPRNISSRRRVLIQLLSTCFWQNLRSALTCPSTFPGAQQCRSLLHLTRMTTSISIAASSEVLQVPRSAVEDSRCLLPFPTLIDGTEVCNKEQPEEEKTKQCGPSNAGETASGLQRYRSSLHPGQPARSSEPAGRRALCTIVRVCVDGHHASETSLT